MRPTENIEKLIKNIKIDTNAEMDKAVLDDVLKALDKSKKQKSANLQPSIWRIIVKSRITRLATAVVVVLAVCWLTVSNRGELEQQGTNGPAVAVIPKTPAELMSFISLSMAFRDGDMEAVEEQCRQAEKLVRPGLERITIEQLLCELEECEET